MDNKYGHPSNACQGCHERPLDVKFTPYCNANCAHCIERGGFDITPGIDEMVNATIDYAPQSILILGGEPGLVPSQLAGYLAGIANLPAKVYITTNGTLLAESEIYISELDRYVTGINLSINHPDEAHNTKVYNWKVHGPTPTFRQIERGIACFGGYKIRLNVNLVRGFVDNLDAVEKTLALAQSWGIKTIRFGELQGDVGGDYVEASFLEGWHGLKLHADPFLEGCVQEVEVDGITVQVKQVCCFCQPAKSYLSADYWPLVQHNTAVLYGNGHITSGWIKAEPALSAHQIHLIEIGCHASGEADTGGGIPVSTTPIPPEKRVAIATCHRKED